MMARRASQQLLYYRLDNRPGLGFAAIMAAVMLALAD